MASFKELQSPGMTSLRPRDIAACLRLKLWSPEENRFIGFDEFQPAVAVATEHPAITKPKAAKSGRSTSHTTA
jgi:hypothetical protein